MRSITAILITLLFCAPLFAQTVPASDKFAVEVFGNEHGGEARFLALGQQGGAIGLYGGAADGVLDTGDAIRFGAIARYNIISNGNAPVGNLFPDFFKRFLTMFGLPETTPVNTYAGLAFGGLYGHEDQDLSWEIRPHVGVQASLLGMELSRGLGDLTGESDAGSEWLVSVGINYRW
jgi:hypothetical protein